MWSIHSAIGQVGKHYVPPCKPGQSYGFAEQYWAYVFSPFHLSWAESSVLLSISCPYCNLPSSLQHLLNPSIFKYWTHLQLETYGKAKTEKPGLSLTKPQNALNTNVRFQKKKPSVWPHWLSTSDTKQAFKMMGLGPLQPPDLPFPLWVWHTIWGVVIVEFSRQAT